MALRGHPRGGNLPPGAPCQGSAPRDLHLTQQNQPRQPRRPRHCPGPALRSLTWPPRLQPRGVHTCCGWTGSERGWLAGAGAGRQAGSWGGQEQGGWPPHPRPVAARGQTPSAAAPPQQPARQLLGRLTGAHAGQGAQQECALSVSTPESQTKVLAGWVLLRPGGRLCPGRASSRGVPTTLGILASLLEVPLLSQLRPHGPPTPVRACESSSLRDLRPGSGRTPLPRDPILTTAVHPQRLYFQTGSHLPSQGDVAFERTLCAPARRSCRHPCPQEESTHREAE